MSVNIQIPDFHIPTNGPTSRAQKYQNNLLSLKAFIVILFYSKLKFHQFMNANNKKHKMCITKILFYKMNIICSKSMLDDHNVNYVYQWLTTTIPISGQITAYS